MGSTERDQGTRIVVTLSIYGAIVLPVVCASVVPSLGIPGPYRATGLAVLWLGLTIRIWAIAVLGQAFRTTVEVDTGQAVVTNGPYRWVRHPSYTGMLLIVGGFGLAIGNWAGLVFSVALPLFGVRHRIEVEEAELVHVLGQPYRAYRARTKRLVPGVW